MCNKYEPYSSPDEINRIFHMFDRTGNEPWDLTVYPDRLAPTIRHGAEGAGVKGRELVLARRGMPSPAFALKTDRNLGVTNLRNLS